MIRFERRSGADASLSNPNAGRAAIGRTLAEPPEGEIELAARHSGCANATDRLRENILCTCLSLAIRLGLAVNALFGLWWADPTVALIVAIVAVQAGVQTWRGQGCADAC